MQDQSTLVQWITAGSILIGTLLPFVYLTVQRRNAKKGKLILESLNKKRSTIMKKASKILKRKFDKGSKEVSDKKTFVIDFKGDIFATQVDDLRESINYLLPLAQKDDEFIIRIESPGGVVMGYSLASNQLERIKEKGIRLTACVDKVAASGGYMMASVADEIIAAPSAVVGSVGVVSEFPNYNEALKKLGVDWKQYTAGKYKRTVGAFSKITPEAEDHYKDSLVTVHDMFKNHVSKYRELDVDKVTTGEHWMALDSVNKNLNLVDKISVSDDVLIDKMMDSEVIMVSFQKPAKNLMEAMMNGSVNVLEKVFVKIISNKRFY